MTEPNSGGSELTDLERANFELWEREMRRSRTKERILYAAALVSANVVMAGQEVKDRIVAIPGIQWTVSAVVAGLRSQAIAADPDAYYTHPAPQPEEREI